MIGGFIFQLLASAQHVARLEAAGQFPKRVQLGPNRVGWVEDEILDWLKQRIDQNVRVAAVTPAMNQLQKFCKAVNFRCESIAAIWPHSNEHYITCCNYAGLDPCALKLRSHCFVNANGGGQQREPWATEQSWQKHYSQGVKPDGAPGCEGHQTKVRAKKFNNQRRS
jgi:prophage regulatory protein